MNTIAKVTAAGLAGAGLATVVVGAVAAGRIRRVEVVGDSMLPTLEAGDRLVVIRSQRVREGELVALDDPGDRHRRLVKRVAELDGQRIVVLGDNPSASTDSRDFGEVALSAVLGRAVYRYSPADRAGWLGRPGQPRPWGQRRGWLTGSIASR